jgi:hypothetical protein
VEDKDSNLSGGDGRKLFPSLLSDTVERATAPGLRGGNTPASIREGNGFGDVRRDLCRVRVGKSRVL